MQLTPLPHLDETDEMWSLDRDTGLLESVLYTI